jgi:hypothetical protein
VPGSRRVIPWAVCLWLAGTVAALACEIPVFRYALERWQSGAAADTDAAAALRVAADSPASREVVRRILAGHAVVWLVVADAADPRAVDVRGRLAAVLDDLSGAIELPEGIGLPGSELHADVPLLLEFSTLEVMADDPREAALVAFLRRRVRGGTAVEPVAGPLVVPVFGRGRGLDVVPAERLDPPLIGDLTRYLCGACSCQVKEQNPGFDLPLTIDWDRALYGVDAAPAPGPTSPRAASPAAAGALNPAGAVLVPIPPGRAPQPTP